ncbi:Fam179b protein [Nymphaea thermarum]|nr:Fam179b protein [Nymphaea thermarum]
MALRALDNTPEHTPERPKKAPKKSVCAGIENHLAGNEENTVPGSRSPAIEKAQEERVDYIASADLQPLLDPEKIAQNLLQRLESKDWIKVCEALNDVRRLAIYHSASLTSLLDRVVLLLVKAMKNPRSALCKTSIMTSTDLFNGFGHVFLSPPMSDVIDTLLLQLLLKASQDKRFVCEEAEMTLNAMVKSSPALPLLRKLEHYVNHSNLRVRAKAAVSISNCIAKLEMEPMKEYGFSKILHIAADLLNDRLPVARDSARSIIASVHAAFSKDHGQHDEEGPLPEDSWKSFCATSLPPIAAQAVEKIVQQQ